MQARLNRYYIDIEELRKQIRSINDDEYRYSHISNCTLKTFLIELLDELLSNDKVEIELS